MIEATATAADAPGTRREPPRADANRATLGLGERAKTLSLVKLRRLARQAPAGQPTPEPALDAERPRTRGDCKDGARPCPWVSCKYHLYLDVDPELGSIKVNFPDREPWELRETCVLDVADRGKHKLGDVGEVLNVTRERIRQIETRVFGRIREAMSGERDGDADLADAVDAAAELADVSTEGRPWPLSVDDEDEG